MWTLVAPSLTQGAMTSCSLYTIHLPSLSLFPPLVGTTMILAAGPPARLINVSMMPVPARFPPPTMTSVPFAGPYSGASSGCAEAIPKARIKRTTDLRFTCAPIMVHRDLFKHLRASGVYALRTGLVGPVGFEPTTNGL